MPESALSPATHADLFDALVFCLPSGEQCLSYPVAGPDNDLRPGHRRCNFVWYRPAPAPELRRMLTDAAGHVHALGIPPPLVRAEVIAELRAAARALLPPQLEEVIRLTAQPFLQPIYDVEAPRMAVGRVALLGDAAFLARPHVAAGVTKAAEDAMALATALQSNGGVESALAAVRGRPHRHQPAGDAARPRPRQLSAAAADECEGAPQSRTAPHPASRDERDRGAGFSGKLRRASYA